MITWSKEIEVTPKNCKDYFADNAWLCYRISFNRNHSFYKIVDFQVLKLATESKKKNATANKLYIFMQWIILSHWVLSIYTNKISSRGELYMFGWTSIRGRLLLENCFCWRKIRYLLSEVNAQDWIMQMWSDTKQCTVIKVLIEYGRR